MKTEECTTLELLEKVQKIFSLSPELVSLLGDKTDASTVKEATDALRELLRREKERIASFANLEFKHITTLPGKVFVIEVDNGATEATGIPQVRLETAENVSPANLENLYELKLISICESVDEALLLLEKLKQESKRKAGE